MGNKYRRLVIFEESPYPGRVDSFLRDPKVRELMATYGVAVVEKWEPTIVSRTSWTTPTNSIGRRGNE